MSNCNKPTAPNRGVMVTQKVLTAVLKLAQMIYKVLMGMGKREQTDQTKQNELTEQTVQA